ncbi:reverse transcriptase domain-containing protein [Aliarcobacter butzleri]|uniref:RNA-directed DNA polymerase n=1 Tax=Aliarcobacter butzleri TaxID=28197 RepID=A0AAW7QAV4_9BACT|nr:reverse transcriptase domain-containing protein [Aliarcobacter butzleri]MDN5106506.1 reverse transcriptase domain-containing protein [Aliarcobacter butzleri]MDN5123228.1 reverse transcriptase domain-containing protein [Aliarcobacter butzleri]
MNKISLEDAFNLYFHNEFSFYDFCNLNLEEEYTEFFYSKNTFSPSIKLKKYQQFLNYIIFDFLEINSNVVFSYRKGVNSYDAIFPHKDSKYIFTTDIQEFFNHINSENLKKLIISNKEKFQILENDIEKYIDEILNLVTYKGVLPIGSPASPKISNAYLFKFDKELEEYCRSMKINYTRYSDDFIFSSNDLNLFSDLETMINKKFLSLGFCDFNLNIKKTKIQKKGFKVVVLGLVITPQGNITVDNKIKKNIEVLFHFYLMDKEKFRDFFDKNYSSNKQRVSGIISHINSIDKFFISKLRKKYGSYIVNSFIDRSIDCE